MAATVARHSLSALVQTTATTLMAAREVSSAAKRRRERRLRSMLRHERQTVAMVLVAAFHHSRDGRGEGGEGWGGEVGHEMYYGPRAPKTASTAAGTLYCFLDDDEVPADSSC